MSVIPTATYRLQFHRDFTFAQARALVPYLARLGISHVYASPFFRAAPGSMHGYDVCDHNELNPEVGTRAEFDAFSAELKAHGLGLIVDFVPNHMGIEGALNRCYVSARIDDGTLFGRCPASYGAKQDQKNEGRSHGAECTRDKRDQLINHIVW